MAEERHDPLDLFRGVLAASTSPTLLTVADEAAPSLSSAAYISFPQPEAGPINLVPSTPTRYTSKAGQRTEFYTLAQIYLAWTEREAGVREYLEKGQAEGAGYVSVADRRGVVDYLEGRSEGGERVIRAGESVQEGVSKASETVEGLPLLGSAAEAGPSKQAAAVKRKYEVDVADREFCRNLRSEGIELRNRETVLRASVGGKVNDFSGFVHSIMHERIKAFRQSLDKPSGKSSQQAQTQQAFDPGQRAKKARQTNPIIVISSSPTSLLTMWNVKKFMEQGIFEQSEVARQNEALQGNVRAEDMVPIMRHRTGPGGDVTNKYYVVDSIEALQKFGQDAWDRVICVITTGQAWQFKSYKWQDPKQLFRHVKGVYFQWSNEPGNPAVRDWNITEMRIDKNKRHTDRQVVAEFWRILDSVKRR